jgi:hypothetical protein
MELGEDDIMEILVIHCGKYVSDFQNAEDENVRNSMWPYICCITFSWVFG